MSLQIIANKPQETETVDESSLECPICLQLFYDPYVGRCGHSYCRGCLVNLSRFDKKCPLCRQPFGQLAECHPNVIVKYLIQKHFPKEFEARRLMEASSPSTDGLKLILRNEKKRDTVQSTNSYGRVSRAVIPFFQSLVPLAYDIFIIMSYVITIGELVPASYTTTPHRIL